MKKRFYIGALVFAVLLLALGRLIARPPGRLGIRWAAGQTSLLG
jgi:hypothetical protein